MAEHAVVFITVANEQDAIRIAETLVSEKLAACVSRVDRVSSVFRWEGKIQRESELLLIAKTAGRRLDALIKRVKELHSYSVPEVIALPIERGNPDYLSWIDEVTG